MADIRTSKFWSDLIKKVLTILLKNSGLSGRAKTHNQHVVPHDEGWAVKGEGNERYTGVYKYQDDAIDRARRIAKRHGASLIIHRKDGSIRDRVSYQEEKKD